MITFSTDLDLGRDEAWIKDARDALRQKATAERILASFYGASTPRDVLLLADEVGMGKTFVALSVAFSILEQSKAPGAHPDLHGCQRRILVIAPQRTLAEKWTREVATVIRRCMDPALHNHAASFFRAERVEHPDVLARMLRQPYEVSGQQTPTVIVTHMGCLSGGRKLADLDGKQQLVLGSLFRLWGKRFGHELRQRLLTGAPEGWTRAHDELTRGDAEGWKRTPFRDEQDLRAALGKLDAAVLDELLATAKELAASHVRGRPERLKTEVLPVLTRLYRRACFAGITEALPLVIVDEAHHWKNGPSTKSNGYDGFERDIAPLTRRALLLTATPFQLRPAEMLEILRVSSIIAPAADPSAAAARRQASDTHRSDVLTPVLNASAAQSRVFAKAWGQLGVRAAEMLAPCWSSPRVVEAREQLRAVAHAPGRVSVATVETLVEAALVGQPEAIRAMLREGLRLYAYNQDLSHELGDIVIRHRRRAEHRVCRVGSEYVAPVEETLRRSDRSVLHASRGMDVHGEAELPHYLLMRCVSEMKGGKGRTSLGTALTGCYSTLLGSSEGRALKTALGHGTGKTYLDLLLSMVGEAEDPTHPKVQAVVEATARAWRSGEKVLIFCFRTHTAHRLKAILEARIGQELAQRREAIVGGDKALQSLRGRITSRDGELATLAFDRVLWSLRWAVRANDTALYPIAEDALRLDDADLEPLARLALRYGVDLTVANPDRVFVHRAVEHLLGRRLARGLEIQRGLYASVLAAVSAEAWVAYPYGVSSRDDDGDEVGADERGVHSVYAVKNDVPSDAAVRELTQALVARRHRARVAGQVSLFDAYADGPSFWLGEVPSSVHGAQAGAVPRAIMNIHRQLLSLSRDGVSLAWRQRRAVMSGLRSAVLRESVLVRLLPERLELEESQWGTLLVRQLYRPLGGQRESMADRLAVFVEDLQSAEGKIHELPESSRHILYEATRMRGADFVVLVDGSTDADRRRRVFAGFNSPLLPEVLVCTSVGQEGIDLHRHCRHVVHYDLAWNPAVVEQRTGRVDRLGSKTFRERSAGSDAADPSFLDVGVPFLAGTYDERMYEELRIRAQTFEVLTGGDVTSDDLEGRDDSEGQEGELEWALLPSEMVADLRVRLHVWEDAVPR